MRFSSVVRDIIITSLGSRTILGMKLLKALTGIGGFDGIMNGGLPRWRSTIIIGNLLNEEKVLVGPDFKQHDER